MTKQKTVEKGSPIWGLNRFRQYLLSALLEDLEALEVQGLDDEKCDHVKECLKQAIAKGKNGPSVGYFQDAFANRLPGFLNAYEKWNGPTGRTEAEITARRQYLAKLRKQRRKFSARLRPHQIALGEEINNDLPQELWEAVADISKQYPDEFPSLAKAVRRVRNALNAA